VDIFGVQAVRLGCLTLLGAGDIVRATMAEPKRTKTPRKPKGKGADSDALGVTNLLTRGVPLAVVAALDAMVEARRIELLARATDSASRRVATSFSRNDLVVDILSEAVARSKASPEGSGA